MGSPSGGNSGEKAIRGSFLVWQSLPPWGSLVSFIFCWISSLVVTGILSRSFCAFMSWGLIFAWLNFWW